MSGYIVTINRPYYPSVEYFDTVQEAHARAHQFQAQGHEADGEYAVLITVASVLDNYGIRTHY